MRTDIIEIDHHGNGFEQATEETRKAAAYHGLTGKDSMHLQLCTEEMLSMVRSVTGGIQAKFWIDTEGKQYELHLSAQTVLDKEERAALIAQLKEMSEAEVADVEQPDGASETNEANVKEASESE